MSKAHSMAKLAGSWTSEFPDFLLFIVQSLQASSESKPYVIPQTELEIQNPSHWGPYWFQKINKSSNSKSF